MPKVGERYAPLLRTADGRARVYVGDCLAVLKSLPAASVQCCVTSPPYFGLRDYGVDGQIGLEATPEEFVSKMVEVFREVRRVLRDDGTLWLNLGDSYNADGRKGRAHMGEGKNSGYSGWQNKSGFGTKPKDLLMIPARVALALQADGWWLRSDIIWAKRTAMPESVRDRCTKAHEYVFLLAKEKRYYADMEAIKTPSAELLRPQSEKRRAARMSRPVTSVPGTGQTSKGLNGLVEGAGGKIVVGATSNRRSVWPVEEGGLVEWLYQRHPEILARFEEEASPGTAWWLANQPFRGAHFATFPPKLIEPMVKAGTSERGRCPACGTPWVRLVTSEPLVRSRPNDYTKRTGAAGTGNSVPNSAAGTATNTVGWEAGCSCAAGKPVPCVVLDPFLGSGTTARVALDLGRACVGIELNEDYVREHVASRLEPYRPVVRS